jgi:hypothetical protein
MVAGNLDSIPRPRVYLASLSLLALQGSFGAVGGKQAKVLVVPCFDAVEEPGACDNDFVAVVDPLLTRFRDVECGGSPGEQVFCFAQVEAVPARDDLAGRFEPFAGFPVGGERPNAGAAMTGGAVFV